MVGFSGTLLFFFVPETFWDRTPRPKSRRPTVHRNFSSSLQHPLHNKSTVSRHGTLSRAESDAAAQRVMTPRQHMLHDQNAHARFEEASEAKETGKHDEIKDEPVPEPVRVVVHSPRTPEDEGQSSHAPILTDGADDANPQMNTPETTTKIPPPAGTALPRKKPKPSGLAMPSKANPTAFTGDWDGSQIGQTVTVPLGLATPRGIGNTGAPSSDTNATVPHLHNLNSPYYVELEKSGDYLSHHEAKEPPATESKEPEPDLERKDTTDTTETLPDSKYRPIDLEKSRSESLEGGIPSPRLARYTTNLRQSPPKSYVGTLKIWNGRLSKTNWFRVALRPFILFAYPGVLWSALVYSLSVGWLIVLSESISAIYKSRDSYNFTSLQAGLVYISPFVGGILGTAVAGKVSDIIVRYMARKNGGVYEPEFRLVMAIPVAISTAIGLMGFGWSAQEGDLWIVPTIFFGVISFGCSLGSTTAITFSVDSYRQYAGEALVTLNFSKNIFHGLVFSLFFANWLESDGTRSTFLAIGGIQIACMFFTIPM